MGKYALSEIWHTLFYQRKALLNYTGGSLPPGTCFWTTGTWVSEEEKRSLLRQVPLLVWRPFWLWYLLTLSSTSFHWPSLFPFLSPHILLSVYWPPQMQGLFRFMYFFSCSPPVAAAGENTENTHQLSLLPDLLLCSHSAVDMQCSVLFTFQCYRLFPDAWAFCLILHALILFLPLLITVHSAFHR